MSDVSRVEEVYLAAVEQRDPDQRAKYLDGVCGGDADLRRRVETLLEPLTAVMGSTGGS